MIKMSNGHQIPAVGLGTFTVGGDCSYNAPFQVKDPAAIKVAVSAALDAGYRHIDTATIYGNEDLIGAALKAKMTESGIKREDMFITTKVGCQ